MAIELTLNRRSRKGCVAIAIATPSHPPTAYSAKQEQTVCRIFAAAADHSEAAISFRANATPFKSGRSTLDDRDRTDTKRTTPNGQSSRLHSPYCICK